MHLFTTSPCWLKNHCRWTMFRLTSWFQRMHCRFRLRKKSLQTRCLSQLWSRLRMLNRCRSRLTVRLSHRYPMNLRCWPMSRKPCCLCQRFWTHRHRMPPSVWCPMWSPSKYNLLWSRLNRFTTQFRWTMTSMRWTRSMPTCLKFSRKKPRSCSPAWVLPCVSGWLVQTMPLPGWRCCVACTPSKAVRGWPVRCVWVKWPTASKHRPSALVPMCQTAHWLSLF